MNACLAMYLPPLRTFDHQRDVVVVPFFGLNVSLWFQKRTVMVNVFVHLTMEELFETIDVLHDRNVNPHFQGHCHENR